MSPAKPIPLVVAVLFSAAALQAFPEGRGTRADAESAAGVGEVVFATSRDGDFEVYSMAADGSSPRNLSRARLTSDLDPAWSPGGARIAFSRYLPGNPTAELYVMNADGSGKERLTQDWGVANDREPVWNPTGTAITFTRTMPVKNSSRIFVMRANGAGRRPLTRARSRSYDSSPSWSPSGGRIAFVSDRSGGFPEIWVMNADGTEPRRLTTNRKVDANPAWSPDGTRIAFERCCPDGSSEIFVMNADGTGTIRLTTTPANETQPTWSPDASTIAFVASPAGGGDPDVHAVSLDGTGEHVLTDGTTADLAPDWQRPLIQPSPEPMSSPEPTPSPDPTPSPEPSATPEPSPTSEISPAPDPTPSPEASPTVSSAASPSPGGGTQAVVLQGSVSPGVGGSVKRPRYRVLRSWWALPGLRYRRILDRWGPNRIHVLRVNPAQRPTLDMALAGGDLPGFAPTSRTAAAHRAVAAVNGDFNLPGGRPVHPFAEDGTLHQTSFAYSHNVAVAHTEDATYFRRPTAELSLFGTASGEALRIDRWNRGEPTWGEIGAYTPFGDWLERPPRFACSARLRPVGARRWVQGELGVSRDYVVAHSACRRMRMSRLGGVVLAAQPGSPEALLIDSLLPGEPVSLIWSFGWTGVADSVGGFPLLIRNGHTLVTHCSASFCGRHPRTAIGVDREGRLLLVVVDGRRRRSVGMKLLQLARLMKSLGAVSALNLDGGGSSTMVVRGRVVNRPSDGRERWVSTAVMVLDDVDPGERIEPVTALATAGRAILGEDGIGLQRRPSPTDRGARSGRLALYDPASTGGMLDAVDRRLFGGRGLPPGLRVLLRGFRASRWTGEGSYRARPTGPR